jgi:hypothetical protein
VSTAVLDTDFEAEHAEYAASAVAETPPVADVPSPISDETPAQKRAKLMGSGSFYRDSAPHQAAAQTWAIVELVDATAAQTDVLARQNELLAQRNDLAAERNAIAARHAGVAEQQAAESRVQTILSIYSTDARLFPAGVLDQLKAFVGLTGSPAEPVTPGPATTEESAETEFDFS